MFRIHSYPVISIIFLLRSVEIPYSSMVSLSEGIVARLHVAIFLFRNPIPLVTENLNAYIRIRREREFVGGTVGPRAPSLGPARHEAHHA